MRPNPPTRPAPRPSTTQAVQAVIAEQGADWPVVSFQTLTIVQALMEDGEVEYRLIWPQDQAPEGNIEILIGAAKAEGVEVGEHHCICGASSECSNFPHCLPGGAS